MALQEARAGGRGAGRKGDSGEPAWAEEYRAEVARGERDAARQQEIFEARREELLAAHPGRHIAVCAGEVFAADTDHEVTQMVMRAHPGRASFFCPPGNAPSRPPAAMPENTHKLPDEPAWAEEYRAEVARGERDAARQQEIFEARREELLAAHPGKHIAVCAGEVFAADTDHEVTQMVMRAHPGRTSFLYSPGCTNVNMF